MQKILENRIFRFILAGGCAAAIEYSSFYLLYAILDWKLLWANSTSFLIGLITSFLINRSWAFKSDNYERRVHHQFGMYAALAIVNLALSNFFIAALKYVGLDPRVGKVVAIIMIATWNYLLYKKIIFLSKSST